MYEVISEGVSIAICDNPIYVRLKPETGCYVSATKENADGISINGKGVYSLNNRLNNLPETNIRYIDGGTYMFENRKEISNTEKAIEAIENALCDFDAES